LFGKSEADFFGGGKLLASFSEWLVGLRIGRDILCQRSL
jgi:hypothetical protein